MAVDRTVLDWIVAHRTPGWTDAFTAITTAGNTVAVALATVVIAVVLARRGARGPAVALVASVLLGWLLMNGLKFLVRRARPPEPERLVEISTYSFPSGHAMMSAVFAVAVVLTLTRAGVLKRRRAAAAASVVLAAASLLIGFSRIYLGAHWLTDVIAGWAFGALWGACGTAVLLALTRRRFAQRSR